MAVSATEYAVPEVALPKAVVVTESGDTTIGVIVIEAVLDLVESATLVAVIVAAVVVVTDGAW